MKTATLLRGMVLLLSLLALEASAAAPNVVVVTLDGVRVQEMFGGIDDTIVQATTSEKARAEFAPWQAASAEQRRELPPRRALA